MQITIGQLRCIIREQVLEAAGRISAGADYMKKEKVRERLQKSIVDSVKSGKVKSQKSLEKLIKSMADSTTDETEKMALLALKMVSFDSYLKM